MPFDEELNDPTVWFFDHIYHETMFNMMRKINSKERIVGWYSTGPAIKKADIDINEILRKYNNNSGQVARDQLTRNPHRGLLHSGGGR